MMNLKKFGNVKTAEKYYDHDDYYSESGHAPSQWRGSGAELLRLTGQVDRVDMRELMLGHVPGQDRVGMKSGDEWKHAPGTDVTFSAPKSFSIMALEAGDSRLIDAHRVAVADALAFIEERVAACRIRENGTVTRHETGNLVIASFDHSSSRAKDAQLHTHNLIMNLTMDSYGKWRSLESSELYKIHHEADRVYKQVLAQKALTLGYDLIKTKHGPELSCVPEEYRDLRSTRKNQIDDYLEKRGLTRETASASIRDLGNLATRMAKDLGMDRVALLDEWRRTAKEAGFQSKDHVAGEEKRMEKGAVLELAAENADNAVDRAIKHLELRESRFSTNELKDRALEFGHGSNMTLKDVEDAVKRSNKLAPAKYNDKWGFTTHNALKAEAIMLGIELNGRHRGESMMTVEEAEAITAEASKNNEYGFNKGQTEAIIGTLSNQAQIQAVQGYAGTSKTNSVAATVRQAMTDKGFKVVGMAPTSKARNQLTECAGIAEGFTVDKFLGECQRGAMNNTDDPQYWIVDEASMLSASKMRDLLREAEKQNAKVLLIGDIKQLSSIDAGAAFRQLQESGMVTYVLDEIVRQKNTHAKEGVFNAMKGNVAEAMAHIDRNAKVVEVKDDVERRQEMTSDYLAMTKEQRSETLVLEPTRAGRNEANDLIRAGLREAGELSGVELQATRLDGKDLTPSEKELVSNYEKDELITFNKNLASIGIEAGEYYRVGDVDLNSGVVTLKGQKDQEIEWRPERMGASSANVFQAVETNLTAGDKITWKQNDKEKGLDNGDELVVLSAEKGVITAIDTKGKEHGIDPAKHNDQHFAYSYATTVHASQGMTKDNALANFSSKDSNLLNQQLFYVGASRVKDAFQLYTDNRERLTNVIQSKTGQKSTALDDSRGQQIEKQKEAEKQQLDKEASAKAYDAKLQKDIEVAAEKAKEAARERELDKQHKIATGKDREGSQDRGKTAELTAEEKKQRDIERERQAAISKGERPEYYSSGESKEMSEEEKRQRDIERERQETMAKGKQKGRERVYSQAFGIQ